MGEYKHKSGVGVQLQKVGGRPLWLTFLLLLLKIFVGGLRLVFLVPGFLYVSVAKWHYQLYKDRYRV